MTQCELSLPLSSTTAYAGSHSKTSLDCSRAEEAQTLLRWLGTWLGADSAYRTQDGKTPVLLPALGGFSNGQLWTRNSSEWRKDAAVCSLSEILETGPVAPRYFLSAKACRGILRRAEKRGKALPMPLQNALTAVAETAKDSD